MNNEGRIVYIPSENIMGEIVSEQLYGAKVRYIMGGFQVEEFLSNEDYEVLDYFTEEESE